MSPRFVLGRENVPWVAEVVNRSLKADCTDFTDDFPHDWCRYGSRLPMIFLTGTKDSFIQGNFFQMF